MPNHPKKPMRTLPRAATGCAFVTADAVSVSCNGEIVRLTAALSPNYDAIRARTLRFFDRLHAQSRNRGVAVVALP
jgi:hypothetical protein